MKKFILAAPLLLAFTTTGFAQTVGLGEGQLTALDADGDASISMAEYQSFANFAFSQMDADKSGTLSAAEMAAHADAGAFARTDADGNGTVTAAEFKARMDANFKAADKDGDGLLN